MPQFIGRGPCRWSLPRAKSSADTLLVADGSLAASMDPAALEQLARVAALPGCVSPAVLMPDGHSGYGFPIGGVAAFDPKQGGVVSAGGVGFDIACGVRTLLTNLTREDVLSRADDLAEALYGSIPSGVGQGGELVLDTEEIDAMLQGGASWAVARGMGRPRDLARMEESGRMPGADPAKVSDQAKARIRDQVGSLGSGNHYLEVQCVEEILDKERARAFGLAEAQALLSVHCGSRGLGHQIGRDYMARMKAEAKQHGLAIKDPELACAPINSDLGRDYLAAMRCGVNCALANRQAITHLARRALDSVFPGQEADLLYDVSHNTCKQENGLFVHRKGATRAFGPGHPELPRDLAEAGQPVLVGGSMGTASYVLAGLGCPDAFSSAPHGAGRAMSRTAARKRFKGRDLVESLRHKGVLVRTGSLRGVAEEAPDAYKDVEAVVRAAETAGLVRLVARLKPMICVKG